MKYNLEHIENYLDGKLSAEEKDVFEAEVANDPELRHLVSEMELIKDSLETAQLKEKIKSVAKSKRTKNKRPPYFRILLVALVILALVLLGKQFLKSEQKEETINYASYFTKDPGIPTPMGAESNAPLLDAIIDYKADKYQLSIEKLEKFDAANDTIQYFKAMNFRALGEMNSAYILLESIPSESTFSERAAWFLVEYFLKIEDYTSALNYLNSVSPERKGYQEIKTFLMAKG